MVRRVPCGPGWRATRLVSQPSSVADVATTTASTAVRGHSVETELVALDVLHHEARLVVAIGKQ